MRYRLKNPAKPIRGLLRITKNKNQKRNQKGSKEKQMNIVERIDQYLEEEAPEKAITGTRDLVKKQPIIPMDMGPEECDPKCKTDYKIWFKKSKKLPDSGTPGPVTGKNPPDAREWLNKQANIKP
jgi:hypothetical protein